MESIWITLCVLSFVDSIKRDKIIGCVYNADKGPPSVIDANLCTHIFVQGVLKMDSYPHHLQLRNYERDKKLLQRLQGLKCQNLDLKIVAALECFGNECYFEKVVDSDQEIQGFVKSAIKVMREHKFNGLDLGWRWPDKHQKEGYWKLLRELKKGLSNKETLSAVVHPFNSEFYDIDTMKSLDFLSLWAFELHGPWGRKNGIADTEHHASDDSVKKVIKYWKENIENDNKILLGIAFFGVELELKDEEKNNYYREIVAKPNQNRYEYSMPYNQICQHINNDGWKLPIDSPERLDYQHRFREPFAWKGKRWVSFENTASIAKKFEWEEFRGLGGVMVWEVTDDDIDAKCGLGDRPLLRAVAKTLFN